MSYDGWMWWGLILLELIVIALLVPTGVTRIKIMFFENRVRPDND